MQLAPAGVPLSFEVTFDRPDLDVGMTVYDDSGASPVLLLSPFAMELVYGNTYRGKFTAVNGKNYIVVKSVYTSSALATLSPDYAAGSEAVVAQNIAPVTPQPLVGFVDPSGCAAGCAPAVFSIFQADSKTMFLKALLEICAGTPGDPLDLTNCSEIDVALPKADGSFTHLLLTDGDVAIQAPALLGKFSVGVDEAISALLNPGVLQNFDVTFTISARPVTVSYTRGLSVFQRG